MRLRPIVKEELDNENVIDIKCTLGKQKIEVTYEKLFEFGLKVAKSTYEATKNEMGKREMGSINDSPKVVPPVPPVKHLLPTDDKLESTKKWREGEMTARIYGAYNEDTLNSKDKIVVKGPCECGCDVRDGMNIGYLFIIESGKLNGIKFTNRDDIDKLIKQLAELKEK